MKESVYYTNDFHCLVRASVPTWKFILLFKKNPKQKYQKQVFHTL
jgi:hypothetical protein